MRYTEHDVRCVEAYSTWQVMGEMFSAVTMRLSNEDAKRLRRGIHLTRTGAQLVVADDPNGKYDSPRLPDSTNAIFGGDYMIALRHQETEP